VDGTGTCGSLLEGLDDEHLSGVSSGSRAKKCPSDAGDVSARSSGDFCRNPSAEVCKKANVAPYARALRNYRRSIRRIRGRFNLATLTDPAITTISRQINQARARGDTAQAQRLKVEMDIKSWQVANSSLSTEFKKSKYGESQAQTVFASVQTALKSAIDKTSLSAQAKRLAKAKMDAQKLVLPSDVLQESSTYRSTMMDSIFACGDRIACLRNVNQDASDVKALSYLALKLFCGQEMQLDGAVRIPGRGLLLCPGQVVAAKNSNRLNEMLSYTIGHELGHNLTHAAGGCGQHANGTPNMQQYFAQTQSCFATDTGTFNCTVASSAACRADVAQKMSELSSDIWGSMALAERVSGLSSSAARAYVSKAMIITACKNQLQKARGPVKSRGAGHSYTCGYHRLLVVTGQKFLSTATNCGSALPRACSTE